MYINVSKPHHIHICSLNWWVVAKVATQRMEPRDTTWSPLGRNRVRQISSCVAPRSSASLRSCAKSQESDWPRCSADGTMPSRIRIHIEQVYKVLYIINIMYIHIIHIYIYMCIKSRMHKIQSNTFKHILNQESLHIMSTCPLWHIAGAFRRSFAQTALGVLGAAAGIFSRTVRQAARGRLTCTARHCRNLWNMICSEGWNRVKVHKCQRCNLVSICVDWA